MRNGAIIPVALALMIASPAFAQVDFSGEWAPLYHEDAPERGPGPELGDYLEMPINTLKVDADEGTQTRLLHFGGKAPESGERTWQGYSAAQWESPMHGTSTPAPGLGAVRQGNQGRSLEVVTTRLRPGYLRKNGAPYSANTVVKEFFDLSRERNGDTWFVVTTVVEDPTYLTEPFVTSTNFKKQSDATGWNPSPCLSQ